MLDVYADRFRRVKHLMEQNGCDALIVTATPNVFYFTGKWIDPHERLLAVLIRQGKDPVVFAPSLHTGDFDPNQMECVFLNDGEDNIGLLAQYMDNTGTVSIDNTWQSANLLELMAKKPNLKFVASDHVLVPLRTIKDAQEIEFIRTSGQLADRVMAGIIAGVRPGITELEIVEELKSLWKKEGIHELSFSPGIGRGPNGANPHHSPGHDAIRHGDMLIIDMGGVYNHYCSDMTRTIAIGEVSDKQREVYNLVRLANETAQKKVKPGVRFMDIDLAARQVIEDGGYGPLFTHRTGHGLGIEIHEAPYVHKANEQLVEPGMVFSIEPGIYIPGEFGVRIEDIVIATEDGCESVNLAPKDLIIV